MVKKLALSTLHLALSALLFVSYLLGAAYWDDLEAEHLIYNYQWNFPLLDFFIWIAIPALALLLLMRSLTAVWIRE